MKARKNSKNSPLTPFFLPAPRNLEAMLVEELKYLGIGNAKKRHLGVSVSMLPEQAYKVVYCSRLASRVLRPVLSFPCLSTEELYHNVSVLPWEKFFDVSRTFSVTSTVANSQITHSHYVRLKLKDAIVDRFREVCGERPSIDTENPAVKVDVFLQGNRAVVSLGYCTQNLHRRGLRQQNTEAPLKENLAAAMIAMAGWTDGEALVDPFCGSGTILAEAAMIASSTPAGFFRNGQGFESLTEFRPKLWQSVRENIESSMKPFPENLISGCDIAPEAVQASETNLGKPFARMVKIKQGDFQNVLGDQNRGVLITNPPYGKRLDFPVKELYSRLGKHLKQNHYRAAVILVPDQLCEQALGLTPRQKIALDNGKMRIHACLYEFRGQ